MNRLIINMNIMNNMIMDIIIQSILIIIWLWIININQLSNINNIMKD